MGPFSLTSTALLVVVVALAVCLPLGVGVVIWLLPAGSVTSRLRRVGVVVALCVAGQVAAIGATFLHVNDSYQFYSSFGDLLGETGSLASVQIDNPGSAASGHLEVVHVHGIASHTNARMLVWLPRQYFTPSGRHERFPVLEVLPGQPGTPAGVFRHFDLASVAARMISAGVVRPFVIVVPPIMIRPPYDTECTNIPHGPQALTWLTTDVVHAIRTHLRVDPTGRHWAVMGWSTGGFCAAKLLADQPDEWSAAIGIGGYYTPITYQVYPHLFGGSSVIRDYNDPLYRFRLDGGLRGDHLLAIAGRQDPESWPYTHHFLKAMHRYPGVDYVTFPIGGHNTAVYSRYIGPSLRWLRKVGAFA